MSTALHEDIKYISTHSGKPFEKLLDLLDRTQSDIQKIIKNIPTNLVSIEDLLAKDKDPVEKMGHALWNLTSLFQTLATARSLSVAILSNTKALCSNIIILMDSTIKDKQKHKEILDSYLSLFNFNITFSVHVEIQNEPLFQLHRIALRMLNELNPKNYDAKATNYPKTDALYGYLTQPWQALLTDKLPNTMADNLLTYFNNCSAQTQVTLLSQIPQTQFTQALYDKLKEAHSLLRQTSSQVLTAPITISLLNSTIEAGNDEEEKNDDESDYGEQTWRWKNAPENNGVIVEQQNITNKPLSKISTEDTVQQEMAPKTDLHTPAHEDSHTPLQAWQSLQSQYFSEAQPLGKFPVCVNHYAYSFYTIVETSMACFWFASGHDYGETRHQRRQDLIAQLKEQIDSIAENIQALQTATESQTKDEKKLFEDIKILRKHIKDHSTKFNSVFGDQITNDLIDLDHTIYHFCRTYLSFKPDHFQLTKTLAYSGSPVHHQTNHTTSKHLPELSMLFASS